MENSIQKFRNLAEKYGFRIFNDGPTGGTVSLCAKNTDGQWTRWIRYDPQKNEVALRGETDFLNIWLYETRPDMTPEKCVAFVDELNNLFEFYGADKILVRDLIDPEDWQEIADIRDASEDERYGKLVNIGGHCCIRVDEWLDNKNTFVLGMNYNDRSFFHASVNGRDFFEYDEGPTREKVESDFADREAERQTDRNEAELGADGRAVFPNLNSASLGNETPIYTITDYFGEKIELSPRVELYTVQDFMGESLPGLAVVLDKVASDTGEKEQYSVLTVSFGEFIVIKNCAYIDTNNNSFTEQLLKQGIAEPTGLHKNSGFCSYPLWHFNEDFLKAIGGDNYKEYSDAYDRYMCLNLPGEEEIDSEEVSQSTKDDNSLEGKISSAKEKSLKSSNNVKACEKKDISKE